MPQVYTKEVVNKALSQIGYQGETYASKYSRELDAVKYYNYAKTGATTWCAIFVDWCVWSTILDKPDVNFARSVMCEPNYDNCGAGCVEKANYFKSAGRWDAKCKYAQCGDQVFFKNSSGKIYHTGIVVDWDDYGIYTVEGSTGGAKVLKRFYSYGDSKIAGFGHPKYTGWLPDVKPEPEPEKEVYNGPWPIIPSRGYFQRGDKGAEVVKMQKFLLWVIPDCLPRYGADGDIGSETITAVKKVQAIIGVKADGFYGYKTQAAAKVYRK